MVFDKKRIIIICVFVLICAAVGFGSFFYVSLYSTSTNSKNVNVQAVEPEKNEPVNILVTGMDDGRKENEFGSYEKRNDAIMIVHYDPKAKTASLVSIPRDTKVLVDGKAKKINDLNSIGGPKYLVNAIDKNFNIKVNYYLQLDYAGFRKIVDSLGGVNVNINNKMNYDDPYGKIHIHLNKGENQTLDGVKAEDFVRWEKNNNSKDSLSSDLVRIRDQHAFMAAVMDKLKSRKMIFKMPSILKTAAKNVTTNMSISDMHKYAKALAAVKSQNLKVTTLSGANAYIDGINYFVYNKSENKAIFSSGETSKVNIPSQAYKVEILNGTEKNGLAKQYKDILVKKGLGNDITTGNYPKKPVKETKVTLYGIPEDYVPYIKSKLKVDDIELVGKKTDKFDMIILQGEDFSE
ncbi:MULTISPECIES: LCP family protein [Clostridium]|uniref:LCP family protein n=1 Tax=Clostridium TaxID=1485 RepID=UPI0008261BF6|nr:MULTISPECIES: LCP family protein [Clostridium]PJI07113.1 LytR family transcriptional regulator [Clostridium sp. CT7]